MPDPIEKKISRLIRPEIRALKAYRVPDATGLVKLDAMENPYSWPEAVRREWLKVLQHVSLNRYPDPDARVLRQRLCAVLSVPSGMELVLGNGSDELIQVILMAVSKPGAVALAPTPTFVMYEMIATFLDMKFVGVPLTQDFSLDMPAMLKAIEAHQPVVIFLAYPNNPTGNLFAREDIVRLIEQAPGLVVLDEAYHAFAGQSFMDQLGKQDNLLVMRTLSKQGLAGLRLGVLAGPAVWLEEFNKVRLPYNVGSLTQASSEFALTRLALLDEQAKQIREDREKLFRALTRLPGVRAWPSQANFILFRIEKRDADEVFEGLRTRGVLIKNLNSSGGMLKGCLRVTVGTPDENAAFLSALEAAL
ncbi:MAG: histidinol-phosphate transaminase [Candidatus Muproteobacteria bacterium RIFCSPLOWO2_01_FULL_60_18]|uniref:Histidinol-phosphate aminotransferase n=1 Tax=Candidatus Muproteobacteria bacterium RIFCSPLOWO2_01_FULL_60_18 TaxID=1817768 RepID=A0A1F6U0Y5_9PROT|nr:MAG: histidinol-phosphate transaminase [Candidatus Muproteobacteria bacterium RIFCSPLOWO2_01_FULL_60_18]